MMSNYCLKFNENISKNSHKLRLMPNQDENEKLIYSYLDI